MEPIKNSAVREVGFKDGKLYVKIYHEASTIEIHGYTLHSPAEERLYCYEGSETDYLQLMKELSNDCL